MRWDLLLGLCLGIGGWLTTISLGFLVPAICNLSPENPKPLAFQMKDDDNERKAGPQYDMSCMTTFGRLHILLVKKRARPNIIFELLTLH